VFLSHATADKWLARVICEKIERTKAKTFRDDRDIQGGDDIPDAVRQAISRSDELLVLITPVSVKRPWVLLEVGAAWGRGKQMRITAVRYHVQVDEIPGILKGKKSIDINELDGYFAELKERVRKHHGQV
jgi:hypothetical protein